MEAYYHSDPRLEQWINQITEKIFAVCLLTGTDSELEFHSGSEIVTKVANLLQGISMFPSEFLEDGLKQLIEQQLPDSRVISNFPTFHHTMNKMIQVGMMKAVDSQKPENLNVIPSLDQITPTPTPAPAPAPTPTTPIHEAEIKLQALELEEFVASSNESTSVNASSLVSTIPTKAYGIVRKSKEPEQAERLKGVLSNIFSNVSITWNLNLMGHTFLAQVEDILICLDIPEQPCPVESLIKEGWKVYVCSSDDLMFPRRLERGIRQVQRFGKQR